MKNYISGWICLIGGIVLEILTITTIHSDKTPQSWYSSYYTYEPPFTGHEKFMIALAVGAAIVILIGLILLTQSHDDKNG